ncbi:MAG: hypothetical protein KA715_04995 [Xanthomonadaceae bacterium]|nr:hypothetical protein [Xanthomonadaceae bacterium]
MKINTITFKIASLALVVALSACSPTPRRTLRTEEKAADFAWLFSQFGENYAPLEYKESLHGFNYAELKSKYLERSAALTTNEQFYALMHEFVAEFKDAHTSGQFMSSTNPGRTEVAYLGFSGDRVGNKFVVKEFLPTFSADSAYPIKVGAVITALDGVPLVDQAKGELAKFRNLGQEQATITYNMNRIFNRISTAAPIPASPFAVVTVKIDDKTTEDIMVPWVKKDYYQFIQEQRAAALEKRAEETGKVATAASKAEFDTDLFSLGYSASTGQYSVIPSFFKALDRKQEGFNFLKTFAFIDTAPIWSSKSLQKWLLESQYGRDALKAQMEAMKSATETYEEFVKRYFWEEMLRERTLPTQYTRVMEAIDYPAYVTPVIVKGADGKPTGYQKYVGYIYLDTFSPYSEDDVILASVNATLAKFKEFGVKDVIIDMINNGGGSLVLGSKLAQVFSAKKITLPDMQFRLSESWMDDFEGAALNGASDAEKQLARSMLDVLKEDKSKGLRLSRGINSEVLMPWEIKGNKALAAGGVAEGGFKTYLLVNEMCASMCDIFSGIMKDNNLGTVVGVRTMGAGGNVVMHMSAPNSGFIVNQTESLIRRKDGSYIENVGVSPDVAFDTIADSENKYSGARTKALEVISSENIVVSQAPVAGITVPAVLPAPTTEGNK